LQFRKLDSPTYGVVVDVFQLFLPVTIIQAGESNCFFLHPFQANFGRIAPRQLGRFSSLSPLRATYWPISSTTKTKRIARTASGRQIEAALDDSRTVIRLRVGLSLHPKKLVGLGVTIDVMQTACSCVRILRHLCERAASLVGTVAGSLLERVQLAFVSNLIFSSAMS